jgi:hypothetical protein
MYNTQLLLQRVSTIGTVTALVLQLVVALHNYGILEECKFWHW